MQAIFDKHLTGALVCETVDLARVNKRDVLSRDRGFTPVQAKSWQSSFDGDFAEPGFMSSHDSEKSTLLSRLFLESNKFFTQDLLYTLYPDIYDKLCPEANEESAKYFVKYLVKLGATNDQTVDRDQRVTSVFEQNTLNAGGHKFAPHFDDLNDPREYRNHTVFASVIRDCSADLTKDQIAFLNSQSIDAANMKCTVIAECSTRHF